MLRVILTVAIVVVALVVLLGVWEIVVLQLESYGRRRLMGRLNELLDAGEVFAGVRLSEIGGDKHKLIAFSPSLKKYVELCTLTRENIAAISPKKTRLVYMSRLPARTPPDYLFGRCSYWAALMSFDARSRELKCVKRGLDAEPLTGGYGMGGVWGGSEDRVFFKVIRRPGFFEQMEGPKWLESLRKPLIMNLVYDVGKSNKHGVSTLPSDYNILDVQFLPGETWFASAYYLQAESHMLGMMTDSRHIAVEEGVPDKPHGIFALPNGDIAIITENGHNLESSGAVYVYSREARAMRLALETRTLVRRARVDNVNGLLFFAQIEDYNPLEEEDYIEPAPSFHYVLYCVSLADLIARAGGGEDTKPLSMRDMTSVTSIARGGSSGYYDFDPQSRKIYFWDRNAFFETDYDGSGKREVWTPPDFKLQWIQILKQGEAPGA